MKRLFQMIGIILFSLFALAGVVYASEAYTINSKEVDDVAVYLSMEGHSEHDIATCATKQRYYTEITEMMNDGYTEQEILDHYEAMYGEQGFREPKRSGFSLLAWTIPFIALGAGAIVVLKGVRKRAVSEATSSGPVSGEEPLADSEVLDDEEVRKIIEEEKRKRF